MRIQNLAVIFVIIILPITLVLQAYIRNLTSVTNIEARYNEILMSSTYDAVRAYQMNTINNDYSGVNTSRQRDIKASVNSFFNSLATGLHKSGSTKAALNEYVPALLFNLYDGFYVYGPYNNVATVGIDNDGDGIEDTTPSSSDKIDNKRPFFNENVQNTENTMYGVKPFTYYSCEYAVDGKYDITINYTLDNYIAVSGWVKDEHNEDIQISGAGYYIDAKNTKVADTVTEFLNNSISGTGLTVQAPGGCNSGDYIQIKAETLGEYVSFYDRVYMTTIDGDKRGQSTISDMNGAVYARYYRYINYNNTKYYFDDCVNTLNTTYSAKDHTPPIFTITNHCRNYISLDQLITLANYEGWRDSEGRVISKDESYSVAANFADSLDLNWAKQYFRDVNPYYYYKKAKNFSEEMYPYLSKIDLTASDAENDIIPVVKNNSFNTRYEMTVRTGESIQNSKNSISSYKISNYRTKNVFDYNKDDNNPELDASSFNAHRIDVIVKTIESSLIKTVSSLNDYYGSNSYIYEMPTISMEDWNSIANGITVAAFMQGVPIGNYKFFNNYCIIGNTTNKEFVSKDAIYIQPKVGELNENLAAMNAGGIQYYSSDSEKSFYKKTSYMSLPDVYKTQGKRYDATDVNKIVTQHNPRCGELMTSNDTQFAAYRKNDYLIESYEHTYNDYRIGEPETVEGKGAYEGYNEYDSESKKFYWKENVTTNTYGLWSYADGKVQVQKVKSNIHYQQKFLDSPEISGKNGGVLYKTFVQQINYYPQYGSSAYECIVSHNGYEYTYDQVLSWNYDGAGITDINQKAKFKTLSEAYATCLAREKEAQYKNLDTMNYHRIYLYNKDKSKLLTIATRKSGEEVGVVAFKGKNNDYWEIENEITTISPTYTMPFHDINVIYNKNDGETAFGK